MPQPPERCLSRKAGIVRCCLSLRIFPLLNRLCPRPFRGGGSLL
ncbi:MAG: hypothetical protein ACLUZX_09270 [Subdoligranulum sp.]